MPKEKKRITVDKDKIKMAVTSGIPLSITTYTLPHEMEVYMEDVLTTFLAELNQTHMTEYLTYCLNELITNAKKANTKRVYFKQKKLDINDPADYELGMKSCKEDTLNDINYYLELQKKAGLYVKLVLQMRNNKVKIEVRNNSELTVFEYKRIHDKLSRSQQYTSIEQAMTDALDYSEGAGLGLVIMILMLEKIGLTEENFQTLCENGETITRLILPLSEETQKGLDFISEEFVKTIDALPQFPENITTINRLLNDPDSKFSDIAMHISSDVALTGELLKMVNSAAFALASPCRNIKDAVSLVGLHGIKNLLFSIGAMQVFDEVANDKATLWENSQKVAFYSYNLARNFCASDKNVVEDSYVCGLLHNMGTIIFETLHPDLLDKVRKVCEDKGINKDLLEKLIAGVNHCEIGARIAEKWNFPEVIADTIRYQHDPEDAPLKVRKQVYLVNIAELLTYYQAGEIDFYQFDPEVLAMFTITTEEQLQKISNKLKASFENGK